ncbi:MAG: (d)CMP kinase [Bacteroidota bacterium]
MQKIVIALDGYSSCGKSTTAKKVASKLGYSFIDSGAMYRAVSLYFFQNHLSVTNPKDIEKALSEIHIHFEYNSKTGKSDVFLNGINVEGEIRKMYISNMVSEVSAITSVRKAMVAQQQRMGKKRGLVMDGRDIGTKVFPDAEVKIFMTADPLIRAQRRQIELIEKGEIVDLDEILANIKKRDIIDSTREEGPLRKADDAIELDTSFMTLEQQVDFVIEIHNNKIKDLSQSQN